MLKALHKHRKELEEHLTDLDNKLSDVTQMTQSVEHAQALSDNDEMLVPLSNGIFLPVKAQKADTLLLNVGAGVVVRRTPQDALKLLKTQDEELDEYRQKIVVQYQNVQEQIEQLEQEVESRMQNV